MPLPPVHGLAVLSPYFKRKATFDPLALVASATFVDLEPLFYILVGQLNLTHQIWHGYLLVLTIYPVLVGLFVYSMERLLEGKIWSAYNMLGFKPDRVKYSPLTIYLCCLAGGFSHLLFDMFTHQSLPYIIFPVVSGNPFYLGYASGIVEAIALGFAVFSVFLWWKNSKTQSRTSESKPNQ
jgi:hypothetical protein